jgi:hypothetical protein
MSCFEKLNYHVLRSFRNSEISAAVILPSKKHSVRYTLKALQIGSANNWLG